MKSFFVSSIVMGLVLIFIIAGLYKNNINHLDTKTRIKFELINPDSKLFPVKESMDFVRKKLDGNYQTTIIDERFNELVYLIEKGKFSLVEQGVSRFISSCGVLIDKNEKKKIDEAKVQSYIKNLEYLQGELPADSVFRLLLQQAIDTSKRLT